VKFHETELKGAMIIEPELHEDHRGFFARVFCRKEFQRQGLEADCVQCNLAFNKKKGTLRGLHYQCAPDEETKLVQCVAGSIYDVIIDLRADSATYKRWIAVTLSAQNRKLLYVPKGFAHGYQTLEDDTTVFYQVSHYYSPQSERGVRWDDPAFGIRWPLADELIISQKDRNWPLFA